MQLADRANRNRNSAPRAIPLKRARFWLICLLFLMWALAISGRLFWLQIVRHKEFVERAVRSQPAGSGHDGAGRLVLRGPQ